MTKKIFLFSLCVIISSAFLFAQEKPIPEKKHSNFLLDKNTSVYTNINISAGYCSNDKQSYPFAKLKIDIAEGVFSNVSICSVAALTAGYNSENDIITLGASIPAITVGYYLKNFLFYAGGGFYQAWYFRNEKSNNVSTSVTIHSYGYEINAGIQYGLNDYISLFGEWSISPHTWMQTVSENDEEWIFPNNFNLGITFSIPWKL